MRASSVHIEADSVVRMAAVEMVPLPEAGLRGARALRSGWNSALDRADQRTLPLDNTFNAVLDGAGVDIYVLDSGILPTHSDFDSRVATGLARNFLGDGRSPTTDCNGHGTFVASQAAGSLVGVAPGARIIPLRVFDCAGSGTVSGIVSAVDYAITTKNAQGGRPGVINFSGGGSASTTMDTAATRAAAAGMLFIDAAGNENANACTTSPARAPASFTVASSIAATDSFSTTFSNFGSCVNLTAVGQNNIGAWPTAVDAFAQGSGTSFSAPIVSGIAAAMWSALGATTPASAIAAALVNSATAGAITSLPAGTPNRLAFSAPNGVADILQPSPAGTRASTATSTATRSAGALAPSATRTATRSAPAQSRTRKAKRMT